MVCENRNQGGGKYQQRLKIKNLLLEKTLVLASKNILLRNSKNLLFRIGHLEGISFILLLFIAMPLKYVFDIPVWVRIVGSLHGVLFVAYCLILAVAWRNIPLTFGQVIKAFLLSFVPLGTFFLHKII